MPSAPLDTLTLAAGARLRLKDGSQVVVTENPRDGVWLFCRCEAAPDPTQIGREDVMVYADDVVEVLAA